MKFRFYKFIIFGRISRIYNLIKSTDRSIILQIIRLKIMATVGNKHNILFIQSDSDSDSDEDQKTFKKTESPLKLQGNFKISGNKIQKNMFQGSLMCEQQYHFEEVQPSKKRSRQIQFSQSPSENRPKEKSTSSNERNNETPQNQQIESMKLTESRYAENQTQQNNESKELKIKSAKMKTSKLLNFSLEDSDEQSNEEEDTINQKIKQQINLAVELSASQKRKNNQESPEEDQNQIKQMVYQNSESRPNVDEKNAEKVTPIAMIQGSNKYHFSRKPIEEEKFLEGYIQLHNQGLSYLYPHFDLIFKDYNTHIASCKKQSGSIGANYYLSIDQYNVKQKNQSYLGKVRSGSQSDVYNIFDNGERLLAKNEGTGFFSSKKRELVATVCLVIGSGPRKIDVYMLKKNVMYSSLEGYIAGSEIGLDKLYALIGNKDKIHHFESRKPQWIPQFGKYFLNFNGKVKKASIRNCVLEDSESKRKVLLFGKEKDNYYNIQIWNPIPPWVALGIIVTQFQNND